MKMTPRLIIIGGLAVVLTVVAFVVFLPAVVFKPAPTVNTLPFTAEEQLGRDLYVSNGCMYCHSQFTRPGDVTPSRPSEAGQFAYDQPHQLGTIRTGPDLANIGLKRGDQWEVDHLLKPRDFTPNSIMPNFSYLSDAQARAIVAYLNTLGNKQTASTDRMVPVRYLGPGFQKNKFPLTIENFNKGREIYAKRCLTCHGCSGSGDGPYAMLNNARPANLRDTEYKNQPVNFFFWRISEGVPGTVMPMWKQSMSEDEIGGSSCSSRRRRSSTWSPTTTTKGTCRPSTPTRPSPSPRWTTSTPARRSSSRTARSATATPVAVTDPTPQVCSRRRRASSRRRPTSTGCPATTSGA